LRGNDLTAVIYKLTC